MVILRNRNTRLSWGRFYFVIFALESIKKILLHHVICGYSPFLITPIEHPNLPDTIRLNLSLNSILYNKGVRSLLQLQNEKIFIFLLKIICKLNTNP